MINILMLLTLQARHNVKLQQFNVIFFNVGRKGRRCSGIAGSRCMAKVCCSGTPETSKGTNSWTSIGEVYQ